jgi:hypothetical protein
MSKHIPEDAEGIRYYDLNLRRRKFKKAREMQTDNLIYGKIDIGLPLAFLHHWNDGNQVNQGFLDQYEPSGINRIVLMSYLDGLPNDVSSVTEEYLERCTFYLSDYEMRMANRPYIEKCE